MKVLLEEYYSEPEKITKTTTQIEAELQEEQTDLEEHGPEENTEAEDDNVDAAHNAPFTPDQVDNKEDDIIVIDDLNLVLYVLLPGQRVKLTLQIILF